MSKQEALKPHDVVVALKLLENPGASYASLSSDLSMSPSTAHGSVERLQIAGLLRPDSREVNRRYLLEFLEHGVKYAFPAKLDAPAKGIGTAHSGPVLANEIVADEAIVWRHAAGTAFGASVTPLWAVDELPNKCPYVYELLTLVDAIRVGRVRERAKAVELLKERLALAA